MSSNNKLENHFGIIYYNMEDDKPGEVPEGKLRSRGAYLEFVSTVVLGDEHFSIKPLEEQMKKELSLPHREILTFARLNLMGLANLINDYSCRVYKGKVIGVSHKIDVKNEA